MADPNLKITVSADTSKADTALKGLQDKGEKVAKAHSTAWQGAVGTYTEVYSKVNLIRDAYQTLANTARAPIEAAKLEEEANLNLVEALKARNTYTQAGIDANNAFANSMSYKLAIDDEAITSIQAYIAGLTDLSGEALNDATQAVIQYAQVTGKSYESAERVITSFVSGATPRVRGLALDVDKEADAHERVNAVLAGTAAGLGQLTAKADTFEGAQARMGVAWENLLEAIGKMITKSPVVKDLIDKIAGAINDFAEYLDAHPNMLQGFLDDVGEMIDKGPEFLTMLGQTSDKIAALVNPIAKVIDAVDRMVKAFSAGFQQIRDIVSIGWDVITLDTEALADRLVGHSIIPDMVDAIIAEYGRMNDATREEVQKNWEIINGGVYQNITKPDIRNLFTGESMGEWGPGAWRFGEKTEHKYIGPVPGAAEVSGRGGGSNLGTEANPIYVIVKQLPQNLQGGYASLAGIA